MNRINSIKTKIQLCFASLLVILALGMTTSIWRIEKIAELTQLASQENQVVKMIFRINDHEKNYFITPGDDNAQKVIDEIGKSKSFILAMSANKKGMAPVEAKTATTPGLQATAPGQRTPADSVSLTAISLSLDKYENYFKKIVENNFQISQLRSEMQKASQGINDSFSAMLKTIDEVQNMALVFGESASPVMGTITAKLGPLANKMKDVRLDEVSFHMYNDPLYYENFCQNSSFWEEKKEELGFLIETVGKQELKDLFGKLTTYFSVYNNRTFAQIFQRWQENQEINASLVQISQEIATTVQELQKRAEEKVVAEKTTTITIVSFLSAAGLLLGIALSAITAKLVMRPLNQAVRVASDLAEGEGDLTQRMELTRTDEFGELGSAIDKMLVQLHELIGRITTRSVALAQSADNMKTASSQLLTSASQTSEKSIHVAAATEEILTSFNVMSSTAEQTGSSAFTVSSAANQADILMNSLNTTIQEITHSTYSIGEYAQKSASVTAQAMEFAGNASTSMQELHSASDEIGKVTQMIKEISSQTNLLALNATIEASRAGDAGKGFGVVAKEIKALSNQSANAAHKISVIIEKIQTKTSEAVEAVYQASEIINQVNQAANEVAEKVHRQVANTEQTVQTVGEANTGISEIAKAIKQIAEGAAVTAANIASAKDGVAYIASNIHEIQVETSHSGKNSKQVDNSSIELAATAAELLNLVKRFKL